MCHQVCSDYFPEPLGQGLMKKEIWHICLKISHTTRHLTYNQNNRGIVSPDLNVELYLIPKQLFCLLLKSLI